MYYTAEQLKVILDNYMIASLPTVKTPTFAYVIFAAIGILGTIVILSGIGDIVYDQHAYPTLIGLLLILLCFGGLIFLNERQVKSETQKAEILNYEISDILELEEQIEEIELIYSIEGSEALNCINSTIKVLTKEGLQEFYLPKDAAFEDSTEKKLTLKYFRAVGIKDERIPAHVLTLLEDKKISAKVDRKSVV